MSGAGPSKTVKAKNDSEVNDTDSLRASKRRSWLLEAFNTSLVSETMSLEKTENEKKEMDAGSSGKNRPKMEIQKKKSFPTMNSEKDMPIERNSEVSSSLARPRNLPRPSSLPIFPSLSTFAFSKRRSCCDIEERNDIEEEFDTSEIILFLSQGPK